MGSQGGPSHGGPRLAEEGAAFPEKNAVAHLGEKERVRLDILANYLSEDQFQDYGHFVKMK